MKTETLFKFKQIFETEKQNLVYAGQILNSAFEITKDETADEVDLTAAEMDSQMKMRLRSREILYLKKIDEALNRIATGNFGSCVDCEGEIEIKRLEARPTATQCVACKEDSERLEWGHIDGHTSKSLGKHLRFAW